jgi:two-component system KDP operon response regulator KdpE
MTHVPSTVLVVEDELPIRRFLRPAITAEGHRLLEAGTLQEGLVQASTRSPDVIIVDLGLPDGDGLELIRRVREWSATPIVVLSARNQEQDKVDALDEGADDYLAKPYSVRELMARIRVALRHRAAAGEDDKPVLRVGELEIDLGRRQVRLGGEAVTLTPIEYKLLSVLARSPGRVHTHHALLREVWGPSREEAHLVRVHMANLRRKLEVDTARPRYLITEPGVGYRLADE